MRFHEEIVPDQRRSNKAHALKRTLSVLGFGLRPGERPKCPECKQPLSYIIRSTLLLRANTSPTASKPRGSLWAAVTQPFWRALQCMPSIHPEQRGLKHLNDFGLFRFACANCKSHLAHGDQLISRVLPRTSSRSQRALLTLTVQQFHGQHGKAFLFEQVFNIDEGIAADRSMTTGLHTVRDIYCHKCGVTVGWKYVESPCSGAACKFPNSLSMRAAGPSL